ncbi:unnamed protein product [Meganyctiphanes norvegica]|uniref:C2H2-type domain-containing protein n=1 Tax=Meganyctiphanes norvegica TaxID=48144 RepID=A0AAV2QW55_MEGNR
MFTFSKVRESYRTEIQTNNDANEYQESCTIHNSKCIGINPRISYENDQSDIYEFYTQSCVTLSEENLIDTYERMNPFYYYPCDDNCENEVTFCMHMMRSTGREISNSKKGYVFLVNLDIWIPFYARSGFKVYCCQVCDFKSLIKLDLSMHMRDHIGEKPFVCPVCKSRFSFKHFLSKHMFRHVIKNNIEEYLCLICGHLCTSTEYYKRHVNSHANKTIYSCFYCTSYTCDTVQDLVVHSAKHSSTDINIRVRDNESKNNIGKNISNVICYSNTKGKNKNMQTYTEEKSICVNQVSKESKLLKSKSEDKKDSALQIPKNINNGLCDLGNDTQTFSYDSVKEEIITHENYDELKLKQEAEDDIHMAEDMAEYLAPLGVDIWNMEVEEIYMVDN